ncbi:hypothetical protein Micbo1qcDRAFT_181204 [Microdochium bolleyi]|uniref:Uncharacterized protein n=1 Tax=Microdochium bolleyi TaxID=196109 RepID=A0A136IJ33_9PEZI|nr:hypothetical protein Micbo1qcDRAFT_181204 [Microdochium bolleyi]
MPLSQAGGLQAPFRYVKFLLKSRLLFIQRDISWSCKPRLSVLVRFGFFADIKALLCDGIFVARVNGHIWLKFRIGLFGVCPASIRSSCKLRLYMVLKCSVWDMAWGLLGQELCGIEYIAGTLPQGDQHPEARRSTACWVKSDCKFCSEATSKRGLIPVHSATRTPIPVHTRLLRRLYEAIKFEEALGRACEQDPVFLGRTSVDPPVDFSDDAEKAYKSYVNKLAHVCDVRRGGATVTGVAILQDVDGVIYVLGSNERSPAALTELGQFVQSLFGLVQSVQDAPPDPVSLFTRIFPHILEYNQPRIRSYLSRMPEEIDRCVADLKSMSVEAKRTVDHFSSSSANSSHGFSEPEVRRVKNIPRIIVVPSSTPYPNPLKKARMATASEMLGRMVPAAEVELRQAEARVLKPFGLDAFLIEACKQESFTPLVHGEVLVHNVVRTYLLENQDMTYWNNWRYVGSSKPTCRLCAYYFSEITDVTVRESPGNLYAKWRAPDVYDEAGAQRRDEILNAIAKLIRQDALRTLSSKLPRGRTDDSSSFPTVAEYFARNAHRAMPRSEVSGTTSGTTLTAPPQGRDWHHPAASKLNLTGCSKARVARSVVG